jgi:predicted metal-dependent hydrolase
MKARRLIAQKSCSHKFCYNLCDRLASILDTQIPAVVDRLEASPRSVQVRDLGYRWGSCGHKGDLYFHWRVAMLPRVMIEYVVAHELVHLIEPNHNHAFWDRVEQIVSDWCDRKRWLAHNGASYDL